MRVEVVIEKITIKLLNLESILKLTVSEKTDRTSIQRPIVRTVENDIEIIDDPMGEDYPPLRPTLHNRKASMQLKIIAHNDALENRFDISRRLVNQLFGSGLPHSIIV